MNKITYLKFQIQLPIFIKEGIFTDDYFNFISRLNIPYINTLHISRLSVPLLQFIQNHPQINSLIIDEINPSHIYYIKVIEQELLFLNLIPNLTIGTIDTQNSSMFMTHLTNIIGQNQHRESLEIGTVDNLTFIQQDMLIDLLEANNPAINYISMDEVDEVLYRDHNNRVPNVSDNELLTLGSPQFPEIRDRIKPVRYPTLIKGSQANMDILNDLDTIMETFEDFYPLIFKVHELYPDFYHNMLLAGGSLSRLITNTQSKTDFDFFIYGLDRNEAIAKINTAIALIVNTCRVEFEVTEIIVYIIKNSINLEISYREEMDIYGFQPWRTLDCQFIMRLYNNRSEILHGFDIGASAVGYDGEFYMTKRAKFCYETGHIIIDPIRRSRNYEQRINKYMDLGFRLIMPEFNLRGVLDKYFNSKDETISLNTMTLKGVNIDVQRRANLEVKRIVRGDNYSSDYGDKEASDYSSQIDNGLTHLLIQQMIKGENPYMKVSINDAVESLPEFPDYIGSLKQEIVSIDDIRNTYHNSFTKYLEMFNILQEEYGFNLDIIEQYMASDYYINNDFVSFVKHNPEINRQIYKNINGIDGQYDITDEEVMSEVDNNVIQRFADLSDDYFLGNFISLCFRIIPNILIPKLIPDGVKQFLVDLKSGAVNPTEIIEQHVEIIYQNLYNHYTEYQNIGSTELVANSFNTVDPMGQELIGSFHYEPTTYMDFYGEYHDIVEAQRRSAHVFDDDREEDDITDDSEEDDIDVFRSSRRDNKNLTDLTVMEKLDSRLGFSKTDRRREIQHRRLRLRKLGRTNNLSPLQVKRERKLREKRSRRRINI